MSGQSSTRSPLSSVAVWVAVGVLGSAALGFQFALSALGYQLQKKPVEAEAGIVVSDISPRTLSWERARDSKGNEIPDRRESAEVEKTLGTQNYVSRVYVQRQPKPGSRPIVLDLHVAYYTGKIDTVPHVPDRCFVGGGMQIGNVEGNLPLTFDRSAWQIDTSVPEGLGPIYKVWVQGEAPFGQTYVRLCKDADKIQMRTMKFLADGGASLYAGYFFVANGGHTPSADGVRELAYQLTSTYAYYMKVQVTSASCKNADEFVEASSSLVGELFGDIMRATPDWVKVLQGEWPPKAQDKQ